MKPDKEKILKKFKEKGFLLPETVENDLFTEFHAFINYLLVNEVKLLEEMYRICEKREQNEPLSVIEEEFYNFIHTRYKK